MVLHWMFTVQSSSSRPAFSKTCTAPIKLLDVQMCAKFFSCFKFGIRRSFWCLIPCLTPSWVISEHAKSRQIYSPNSLQCMKVGLNSGCKWDPNTAQHLCKAEVSVQHSVYFVPGILVGNGEAHATIQCSRSRIVICTICTDPVKKVTD